MTSIKKNLRDDHAQLERRLQRLLNAVDANDSCADLRRIWSGFEANLLDHLGTEERCLFPLVAHEHRTEVEALCAEHRHIRDALTELGICLELHTLRKQAVDELIEFLRQHAAHEDASLYEWVEKKGLTAATAGLFAMFDRRGAHSDSEPPAECG
jgi:hemerythrin-like domain-containing protein